MLIATWNVNGIRARLDRLVEWLESRRPDVVCLQELKADEASFPADPIDDAGYVATAAYQKGWNGVAVLSRKSWTDSPRLIENKLPGMEENGARLVAAELKGGLKVVSVYVPNGKAVDHDDYSAKLRWLDAFTDFVAKNFSPNERVVIAGDFNIVPSDIDSYDPVALAGTIFHTDAERSAYREMLDLGYVDLYREFKPSEPGFSWWDYRGGAFHKNLGLRIDLILATNPVKGMIQDVWIDRDYRKGPKPSDHAPLIVELCD